MRLSARLSLAATCCTVFFTSACSDSTGPSDAQLAAQLAMHFDSLYVSATDAGTAADSNRSLPLTYLELAAAFGANASSVTVTTANGTEHWKGFELEDVETSGSGLDVFLLVAYRESAAHTMLFASFNADGSFQSGGMFANDTLAFADSVGTGSTSRTSVGDSCVTPSASLANPLVAQVASGYSCSKATFNTSLSYSMPSVPSVDPALRSISFSSTSFNGARLTSNPHTVRRVRGLIRMLNGGNRF
jgi:hypothetical protein